MLNKVIMMGRLTRDPELRYTQNNTPVASFTIAVDRDMKSVDQSVDFFDCTAWRQTGEFVSKYFRKGSMIALVGRLQNRDWLDKDQTKRHKTEIVVDIAYFGAPKSESGDPKPAQTFTDMDNSDGELPF